MTITATYANADNSLVAFTDHTGRTRTVPADWPGEFRMGHIDGVKWSIDLA